jgi:Protein of unknown function (DUF2384)
VVVIDDYQQDQWGARRFVRSLGVSDDVLTQSERANPGMDWLTLIYALDRVFLSYGGTMAQAQFLRERQPALAGETPIAALTEAGGLTKVCHAAHVFAAAVS